VDDPFGFGVKVTDVTAEMQFANSKVPGKIKLPLDFALPSRALSVSSGVWKLHTQNNKRGALDFSVGLQRPRGGLACGKSNLLKQGAVSNLLILFDWR
jgi:hypothetical protein